MSYATIADLKAASGDHEIADDNAEALRILEFADAKINAFCFGADETLSFPIAPATSVPLIVVQIAAAVAARGWINPAGAQAVTDTAGPSTLQTSFGSNQAVASVPLALRMSEKDDLAPYVIRRKGLRTIATENPISEAATNYINVVGGDKPFPWPSADIL